MRFSYKNLQNVEDESIMTMKGGDAVHKGVFKGSNLSQNYSILILGESHHYQGEADDPEYTTERVVKNYFNNPNDKCYKFFDKIAACFGFAPDDREKFWNQVWFGNYVTESNCGVRDGRAQNLIREHRDQYNKKLFEFVNEHGVDIIFCFSRQVYKNLPGKAPFESADTRYDVQGKRDYIMKFLYQPGRRLHGDVALHKPLTVYGFCHPSAWSYFKAEHYAPFIKKLVQL